MYVVTSIPFVSRTRATFRSAEFGFLGVEVYTRVQTPRFCGQLLSAGLEVFQRGGFRPLRTSWLNVGTNFLSFYSGLGDPLAASQLPPAPKHGLDCSWFQYSGATGPKIRLKKLLPIA
jgi:hypothetical protein